VVFPAAAFAEKEGVTVNCERRLQRTARALSPRRGARADWEIFQAVARALGASWSYRQADAVFREIARLVPGYEGRSFATLLPLGPQWAFARDAAARGALAPAPDGKAPAGEGLWLLSGGTLFLQGSLSYRGTLLPQLAKRARAFLNGAEARRLGIADGDPVELRGPQGALRLPAAVDDGVPEGSVFVPYAYAEAELNRLGAPGGAGLRVTVRAAGVTQTTGA
jgi:predicted molibdopterin-dependent oxidoreductase YjgC